MNSKITELMEINKFYQNKINELLEKIQQNIDSLLDKVSGGN